MSFKISIVFKLFFIASFTILLITMFNLSNKETVFLGYPTRPNLESNKIVPLSIKGKTVYVSQEEFDSNKKDHIIFII